MTRAATQEKWKWHPGLPLPKTLRGHSIILPNESTTSSPLQLENVVHTSGHIALIYREENEVHSLLVILDTIPQDEEATSDEYHHPLNMEYLLKFNSQYKSSKSRKKSNSTNATCADDVPFLVSASPIDIIGCGFVRTNDQRLSFWTMNRYAVWQWFVWNPAPASSWTANMQHMCFLQNPNLQYTKPAISPAIMLHDGSYMELWWIEKPELKIQARQLLHSKENESLQICKNCLRPLLDLKTSDILMFQQVNGSAAWLVLSDGRIMWYKIKQEWIVFSSSSSSTNSTDSCFWLVDEAADDSLLKVVQKTDSLNVTRYCSAANEIIVVETFSIPKINGSSICDIVMSYQGRLVLLPSDNTTLLLCNTTSQETIALPPSSSSISLWKSDRAIGVYTSDGPVWTLISNPRLELRDQPNSSSTGRNKFKELLAILESDDDHHRHSYSQRQLVKLYEQHDPKGYYDCPAIFLALVNSLPPVSNGAIVPDIILNDVDEMIAGIISNEKKWYNNPLNCKLLELYQSWSDIEHQKRVKSGECLMPQTSPIKQQPSIDAFTWAKQYTTEQLVAKATTTNTESKQRLLCEMKRLFLPQDTSKSPHPFLLHDEITKATDDNSKIYFEVMARMMFDLCPNSVVPFVCRVEGYSPRMLERFGILRQTNLSRCSHAERVLYTLPPTSNYSKDQLVAYGNLLVLANQYIEATKVWLQNDLYCECKQTFFISKSLHSPSWKKVQNTVFNMLLRHCAEFESTREISWLLRNYTPVTTPVPLIQVLSVIELGLEKRRLEDDDGSIPHTVLDYKKRFDSSPL